jgi:DUF971 family protein
VTILIVEIDGIYQQVFLTGRKCTKKELKQKYLQALSMVSDIRDLPDVFCRLHHFDKLTFEYEDEVDFVIDTDTDRIYSPSY